MLRLHFSVYLFSLIPPFFGSVMLLPKVPINVARDWSLRLPLQFCWNLSPLIMMTGAQNPEAIASKSASMWPGIWLLLRLLRLPSLVLSTIIFIKLTSWGRGHLTHPSILPSDKPDNLTLDQHASESFILFIRITILTLFNTFCDSFHARILLEVAASAQPAHFGLVFVVDFFFQGAHHQGW